MSLIKLLILLVLLYFFWPVLLVLYVISCIYWGVTEKRTGKLRPVELKDGTVIKCEVIGDVEYKTISKGNLACSYENGVLVYTEIGPWTYALTNAEQRQTKDDN